MYVVKVYYKNKGDTTFKSTKFARTYYKDMFCFNASAQIEKVVVRFL